MEVLSEYCHIIRITISHCKILGKGSPVWGFTIQFYLILLKDIKKHCKYDEIHWDINALKELPL